jgi:hypothetical protein
LRSRPLPISVGLGNAVATPRAHSFKGVVVGDATSRRLAGATGSLTTAVLAASGLGYSPRVQIRAFVLAEIHSVAYLAPICIEGGLRCCLLFCTLLET